MLKLCYEATRPDGRNWAIFDGHDWHLVKSFTVNGLTLRSVFDPDHAPDEPAAYLTTDEPFRLMLCGDGSIDVLSDSDAMRQLREMHAAYDAAFRAHALD